MIKLGNNTDYFQKGKMFSFLDHAFSNYFLGSCILKLFSVSDDAKHFFLSCYTFFFLFSLATFCIHYCHNVFGRALRCFHNPMTYTDLLVPINLLNTPLGYNIKH